MIKELFSTKKNFVNKEDMLFYSKERIIDNTVSTWYYHPSTMKKKEYVVY